MQVNPSAIADFKGHSIYHKTHYKIVTKIYNDEPNYNIM